MDDRAIFEKLWSVVLQDLETALSSAQYETWFTDTKCLDYTEDRLLIEAPNIFVRDWLDTHYKTKVQVAIEKVIGHHMEVSFVTKETETQHVEMEPDTTHSSNDFSQILAQDHLISARWLFNFCIN